MKQSLHLRLSQQLTMTPQLQQAIKLLQMSSLDLQQEIQEALDSNVMLELDDKNNSKSDDSLSSDTSDNAAANSETNTDSDDFDNEIKNAQVDFENTQNDIPSELATDSNWEDTYDSNSTDANNTESNIYEPSNHTAGQSSSSSYSGDSNLFENNGKTEDSLYDHLIWQAELTHFSHVDKTIADTIIDSIDDSGYLTQSIEELEESFSTQDEVSYQEIEAVLHRIQSFDPPGIGARDLQENLLLQLRFLDAETPWLQEAKILVKRHLTLLANRDFVALKRRMKLTEEKLSQVILLIKSLSPRPGSQISDDQPHYIAPDVYVKKINGEWICHLSSESAPNIKINEKYLGMVKGAKKNSDMMSIKDHLQEARWFIKSLQSRNETLLKVSRCILDFQKDFFEYGTEHMRALVLADVAEVVDMHESTISRVTTQKYMHTPEGIFELKYFFSSHVATASGGEASATAIRSIIKKFISAENTRKPLSDSKISDMLAGQNYKVARRTVAKYREAMSIPPSNARKNIV